MARQRGVKPQGGSCSLKNLAEELLGITMDKGAHLTLWNAAILSNRQLEYAHKDVEMGLSLYKKLRTMADLTQPLHKSICSEGCDVDISPSHGWMPRLVEQPCCTRDSLAR
jgi:3'-5' exonuclease